MLKANLFDANVHFNNTFTWIHTRITLLSRLILTGQGKMSRHQKLISLNLTEDIDWEMGAAHTNIWHCQTKWKIVWLVCYKHINADFDQVQLDPQIQPTVITKGPCDTLVAAFDVSKFIYTIT